VSVAPPSRAQLYLRLGRVSNLPTVWTNTLAGVVLSGGARDAATLARLTFALSLFYVGGMFLNDAFDRDIDARERPERPIPSGQVTAAEVFGIGFGLLGTGLVLLALNASLRSEPVGSALVSGTLLGAFIVLYDAWHKQNPFSPVVMGLCRAALYVTAGLGAGGALSRTLLVGAAVLGAYVVGLTFVARQENRKSFRAGATLALVLSPVALALFGSLGAVAWALLVLFVGWVVTAVRPLFSQASPNVPRSVVRLIAGISLVDALMTAAYGAPLLAPLNVLGFGATLFLQRYIRGT
jgi:4-hydroxybenzoate polyprenyltransferase